MKFALVQMRCEKADLEQNLAGHFAVLEEARRREVDIVAFPEMSLTGYADPTRSPQAVLELDGPQVKRFLEYTRGGAFTALAGLIEANPAGKPFITQIAARDGRLLGFYRKRTIVDEETLWFSPGEEAPVFSHSGLTFGIAICADIKNEAVFAACARQGARVVFEVAAPGLYGKQATRNWRSGFEWWRGECFTYLADWARKYGIWIPVATQAGRTCDEDFPGGGYLFSPQGECAAATPGWEPGVLYVDLDLDGGRVRLDSTADDHLHP